MDGIITEVRPIESAGSIKAVATVTFQTPLDEITVNGFKVIQKDTEEPWVGFPQNSVCKDGNTRYFPILEVSKKMKRQIADVILAEFRKL